MSNQYKKGKESLSIYRQESINSPNLIDIADLNTPISAPIYRREFLKLSSLACGALYTPSAIANLAEESADFPPETQKYVVEARYYEKLPHKKIRCTLCPRECVIDDRERGYCGVRENREGTYYSLVYSRPCTYHVDPIEKKPLFHFHPGILPI